jgi:hypothetical protein
MCMSPGSVANSYLSQVSAAEKDPLKKNPATAPSQPASPTPQSDSISLSAAGLAALKALPQSDLEE